MRPNQALQGPKALQRGHQASCPENGAAPRVGGLEAAYPVRTQALVTVQPR